MVSMTRWPSRGWRNTVTYWSDILDKIWAKLPDWFGSVLVTLAVFTFGATIRGMFISLNATDCNSKFSSSGEVEYVALESQRHLHNTEYLSKFVLNFEIKKEYV